MSRPVCPKCKGTLLYYRDLYDTPAVKCLNCGWFLQKDRVAEVDFISKVEKVVVEKVVVEPVAKPRRVSRKKVVDPIPVEKIDGYEWLQALNKTILHIYRYSKRDRLKAFCGATGVITTDTSMVTKMCKSCMINYKSTLRKEV